MPLVVPQAMQVTVSGENQFQPWANVFGIKVPDPFLMASSVADEIATAFRTFYVSISGSLSTAWAARECYINDLRNATNPSYEPAFLDVAGTLAGETMPPQLAIVASHSTGLAGRSYRGRTYLAGWTEAANTGAGYVADSYRTLIAAEFEDLREDLALVTGGPVELAVVSRTLLEATPITSTSVDIEWDRQNRRKRR